ncbi:MAG TPA: N-acetylmuramoyl-L-alanine amidase [Longilinea sp.]|nr:N-acetylmuramoyl-L-alanine amidase [Longilinea sp.]
MSENTLQPSKKSPSRSNRFSVWNTLTTVVGVGIILATLFTLFTPAVLFSNELLDQMFASLQTSKPANISGTPATTALPSARIGVVAGHWGNDSGSVCADGLTEMQVNLEIATRVQKELIAQGYQVDLLEEFDPRLSQYRAAALVSIHNDSCDYVNDEATGFKVAAASSSAYPEKSTRLRDCLIDRYQSATGLTFHYNTITSDMTSYHTFSEIHTDTTAAIIETGFLNLDRQILTEKTDQVAQGVTNGILCYLRNEPISDSVPTLAPTP